MGRDEERESWGKERDREGWMLKGETGNWRGVGHFQEPWDLAVV